MLMEVLLPMDEMDFDFNSARNSPYPSAPSTPRRFGEVYFSAPPSPSRNADFYAEYDDYIVTSSDTIVKIGSGESLESRLSPRSEMDFAFDVCNEADDDSVSAEELFDGGMIKPMEVRHTEQRRGEQGESFAPSLNKSPIVTEVMQQKKEQKPPRSDGSRRERGRHISSSSSRRATRSLSPARGSHHSYPREEGGDEEDELLHNQKQSSRRGGKPSSSTVSSSSSSSSKSQKKWRFKDFFLFRNASEGRASDKDVLRKYTATFRVIDSPVGNNTNSRRKSGPVSAHELHYTENRAAREELKKKTFLPYKGFWGRTPFNAAVANGLGFSHK